MKKYNKQLIFDYINGNDIENFTIDELENDYKFMMEVINYTKDKNLYNLCSDEVKNNYEFIKFMVLTFKDDKQFISKLAKEYLVKTDEDSIEYKELAIIMSSLIDRINDYELLCFKAKAFYLYNLERLEIEICLQKERDEYWLKEFGKGFLFILEQYGSSEIITNFFAAKYLEEIFYKNKYSFEELIHLDCKNFNSIEKMGLTNYLIKYIRNYDNNLANYLCNHLNILDNLKKDILIVKYNWNNYIYNLNERRLDIIESETKNYIEERKLDFYINYLEIIKLAFKQLNLVEYFRQYDDFLYIEDAVEITETQTNNKNKIINISEITCLEFTKKLILELLKKDVVETNYSNYNQEVSEEKNNVKEKVKVLEFK